MTPPVLLWFRQDLRVQDHAALTEAVRRGAPVVPVYIWDPEYEAPWAPGAASRWWLHQSLKALSARLKPLGSTLVFRRGATEKVLRTLSRETGARAVFWSRRYEPHVAARDEALKTSLTKEGIEALTFEGALLFEPGTVRTKTGSLYRKYTPFAQACEARPEPALPLPAPARLAAPEKWPTSDTLDSLGLEPQLDWAAGMRERWTPGPEGAAKELRRFMDQWLGAYGDSRNRPSVEGTSALSPYLHFGEISVRTVWRTIQKNAAAGCARGLFSGAETYLRELLWREFGYHLLHAFPETVTRPLDRRFEEMAWVRDGKTLRRWQQGRTGYPIVDAGLRQLWRLGWMHNRVRMIVGSFLVKDLLLSWQAGAAWFWDTLVDADLASNTMNWQWIAGCGADAAPFFRVFNPVLQGAKFDADGDYIRRWVPELAGLPADWIHHPWEAPAGVLKEAGVTLDKTYPRPLVDHGEARERALRAFRHLRAASVS